MNLSGRIILEFEKTVNTFTVMSIIVMLLCAFVAACFTAVTKAHSNITGEMPKIAGETLFSDDDSAAYYEFKVNF